MLIFLKVYKKTESSLLHKIGISIIFQYSASNHRLVLDNEFQRKQCQPNKRR